MQFTAFCVAIHGLLQGERWSSANLLDEVKTFIHCHALAINENILLQSRPSVTVMPYADAASRKLLTWQITQVAYTVPHRGAA